MPPEKPRKSGAKAPNVPMPKGACAEQLLDDLVLLSFPIVDPQIPLALTPSEQDVVLLVYAGCSNEQIALRRSVSRKTVANQLEGIYRKLGVSSRVELVLLLRGQP